MEDKRYRIVAIAVLAASFIAGLIGGCAARRPAPPKEIWHTDTVTVETFIHDTVLVDRPVYIKEKVVENIYVPVVDTLRYHDTCYVVLPRSQREYADTLYTAWVSGYDPRLDSIRIVKSLHVITQTVKEPKKRWGIGVNAGYGLTLSPQPQLSPYIGLGVTYSIVSW